MTSFIIEPTITDRVDIRFVENENELSKVKKIFPVPFLAPDATVPNDDPYYQIYLDKEGLLYATPRNIANEVVDMIYEKMIKNGMITDGDKIKVIDGTAGIGGNTINMTVHNKVEKVFAVELDLSRYTALANNIQLYHIDDKVETFHQSFMDWVLDPKHKELIKTHPIYLDLPWGGIDYKKVDVLDDIFMIHNQSRMNLRPIIRNYLLDSPLIVLKLPNNYDFEALKQLAYDEGFKYQYKKNKNMSHVYLYKKKESIIEKVVPEELKETGDVKDKLAGSGLYMLSVITKRVRVPFNEVGGNINEVLHSRLTSKYEGKCDVSGYIKTNSIRILKYSSGYLENNNVVFDVVFECLICNPVEGMKIKVKVVNVTKAGLRCVSNEEISPIDVFVARDHNYKHPQYSKIQIGDMIDVKVIGQRFEINDETISVICKLVSIKKRKLKIKK